MGKYQPTVISFSNHGLTKNADAFVIADDAYEELENAFTWRGVLHKRSGYQTLGRLRRVLTAVSIGDTSSATTTYNIFTLIGVLATEPNASLQPGTAASPITITMGAPASTTLQDTLGTGVLTVAAGTAVTSATINYSTGIITIVWNGAVGASATTVTGAYFPGLPAMAIANRELLAINSEETVAFDTKYAYQFDTGAQLWVRYPDTTVGGTVWTGNDRQFFWTTNYWFNATNKIIWATNFNQAGSDPIRYHNGTDWIDFSPTTTGADEMHQCLMLIPYRGRMVALNTWEGANIGASVQFPQRARWSQLGDPTDEVNGWLSDAGNPGRGGFVDCTVAEHIVSAEFVRDTLIVGFERSTWALRYTGNEILPFVWERVSRDLGTESTFSPIVFDRGIISFGDKAITICDGNTVRPIDQEIPDEVFDIHNGSDGPFRIQGARDFYKRLAYWTYPAARLDRKFPNRMLVYNYETGAYSIFTESYTVLGPYQPSSDPTWGAATQTWAEANFKWGGRQSHVPLVLGGNQQGYTLVLNQQVGNGPSLFISAFTAGALARVTVPNHNLESGEIIKITGVVGEGSVFNNALFQVQRFDENAFDLFQYDPLTDNYNGVPLVAVAGGYVGGGQITRIMNFRVRSKKFSMLAQGSKNHLGYIDFLMDRAEGGEVSCYIFRDYNQSNAVNQKPINDPTADTFFNTVIGTGAVTFSPPDQDKYWHRFYCQTDAQFMQYLLTYSNAQMNDETKVTSDVSVDCIVLWSDKGGRLVD